MKTQAKIHQKLKKIGQHTEIIEGNVSSIKPNNTIDIEISPGIYKYNIRLNALTDNSGKSVYVLPKQGAYVICACINASINYQLISCSEIEAFYVYTQDVNIEVSDLVKLNGTTHQGLVKLAQLELNLESLKSLIQQIVGLIPGVVANPNAFTASANAALAAHQFANMENPKVKHG